MSHEVTIDHSLNAEFRTNKYINSMLCESSWIGKNIGSLQLIWTILKPHGPISGELPSITIMSFWALSCSPQNHQWGQQQLTFLGYTRGDVHKIHREFGKLRWKHHSSIQGDNKFQLFTNYVCIFARYFPEDWGSTRHRGLNEHNEKHFSTIGQCLQ